MSNNYLTVESLLADAMPQSNYEWPDSPPHLSQHLPSNKSEEDREYLLKECSAYRDFDPTKFYN